MIFAEDGRPTVVRDFLTWRFFSTETNPPASRLSVVSLSGRYIYSPPPLGHRHQVSTSTNPHPPPPLRSRTIHNFFIFLPTISPPHPLPVGSASETNFRPNPTSLTDPPSCVYMSSCKSACVVWARDVPPTNVHFNYILYNQLDIGLSVS